MSILLFMVPPLPSRFIQSDASCVCLFALMCSPVHLLGTWGDITEDLVLSLLGPNGFTLYFTNSTAAAQTPD